MPEIRSNYPQSAWDDFWENIIPTPYAVSYTSNNYARIRTSLEPQGETMPELTPQQQDIIIDGLINDRRLVDDQAALLAIPGLPRSISSRISTGSYRERIYDFLDTYRLDLGQCIHCSNYMRASAGIELLNRHSKLVGKVCSSCETLYYRWSDGSLHNTNEPDVPEYHSIDRYTFFNADYTDPNIIGIELEVRYPNRSARKQLVNDLNSLGVIVETDPTLDRDGLEIVFPPMSFGTVISEYGLHNHVIQLLLRNKAVAWLPNHAMHVNVNNVNMRPLEVAKFIYFFHNNKRICQIVGGKSENKFCPFQTLPISNCNHQHYSAAAKQGDRSEIRFFKSTLNWTRFVRNCRFVKSVQEYTKTASMRQLLDTEYMKFARTNYPDIYEFVLSKPKTLIGVAE